MGGPTDTERGLTTQTQLDDPAFLAWARQQGKPVNRGTPAGELGELLAQYEYELREQKRRENETILKQAREARQHQPKPLMPRQPVDDEEQPLRKKIQAGWRLGDPSLKKEAETAVNNAIPLKRWLYSSHGSDLDRNRWTYLRHYLYAYNSTFGGGPPNDEVLLGYVVREEQAYLAEMKRRADEFAHARRPGLQLEALKAWARKQTMNPADDFEPGIAYYDLNTATSKADWVDRDIAGISQDGYVTTITYTRGSSLSFATKSLDFKGKYQNMVEEIFARRHKASGRLIPFVLYARSVDLYADLPEIDALSSKDRVLMALPYMLTGAVAHWYTQDPWLQVAGGLIDILKLLALQKGVMMSAPTVAGGLATGARTVYGLGTGGVALTRSVAAEVTLSVETFGYTGQAATYLARSAYTYYLRNAVAINIHLVVGADIGLSIAGQDMGLINPGDELAMAVQEVESGVKSWKAIRAEVLPVETEAGAAKAVVRVTSVETITEDAAKAEYNLGKKVSGDGKGASRTARGVDDTATEGRGTKVPASDVKKPAPRVIPEGAVALKKGRVKLPPDPRKVVSTGEIEDAMKKVAQGLERLTAKYDAKALDKIRNLSADTIRESGINPSDLANLANSLSRAGATTRKFIDDFHDVPGFERVLLSWMKRSYWNSKLKKPAWTATKAFYTGSSYVMKYSTAKLDPKYIRFEWPVSINDTKWGDEVFARYVDIVVSGGKTVKPGEHIQIELKSWTEFVLRMKTRFAPGKATTYPGTVGYQLLRDTALFEPNNIRWIFDGKKVTKEQVLEAFEKIISDDDYLRAQWGGKDLDPAKIRELLDKVIEVF